MSPSNDSDSGVEVWRGGVNAWDCDEMGHMNVRFYVARAMEGLAGLAAALDMPRAFSPSASATLSPRELHVRFLREALAGAPLHMRGWVIEIGETDARLMLVLYHSLSGEPAASFQTMVAHVTPGDGRPFPWTSESRARAAALTAPIPAFAAARSIDLVSVDSRASLDRADALGLITLGRGAVAGRDCDVFGRMSAEQFIGRVSDSVSNLVAPLHRTIVAAMEDPPARVGGVLLEYRALYFDWPRAGDHLVIRSGLAGVDHRTQRIIHWLLNPYTGRAWGAALAVAATFDLDQRKIVPLAPGTQAALNGDAVQGLTL